MNLPLPSDGQSRDLAILTANDDVLTVRLFQNNLTPTQTSVIGDFTEATYDGYAAQTLVYTGAQVHDGANNRWLQPCTTLTYTKGSGTTGNNIYGCYLTDGAGRLRGCGRLDGAPAPMTVVGQTVVITLQRAMASEFASS